MTRRNVFGFLGAIALSGICGLLGSKAKAEPVPEEAAFTDKGVLRMCPARQHDMDPIRDYCRRCNCSRSLIEDWQGGAQFEEVVKREEWPLFMSGRSRRLVVATEEQANTAHDFSMRFPTYSLCVQLDPSLRDDRAWFLDDPPKPTHIEIPEDQLEHAYNLMRRTGKEVVANRVI